MRTEEAECAQFSTTDVSLLLRLLCSLITRSRFTEVRDCHSLWTLPDGVRALCHLKGVST